MRIRPLLCFALVVYLAHADMFPLEGRYPSYSPDGRKLLFQQERPEGVLLGICDFGKHGVDYVHGRVFRPDGQSDDCAGGNAAQAAWHPTDGSIVCVFGDERRTAKEGFFAKEQTGWNLRSLRSGARGWEIAPLTTGRFMDYTPAFSPDGRHVYFASTRVPVGPGRTSGTVLYRVPAAGGEPEQLTDYAGNSSGVSMPTFSPDGRTLLWAELESAFGAWHLVVAPAANPRRKCRIGASDLVAYSPRWSPDGRLVCCTGFRAGDPEWCVYLMDPRTGADRRLFPGREPAISPDGRRLAYSRGGRIYEHVLEQADLPPAMEPPREPAVPEGRALVEATSPSADDRIELPPACAFGDDGTFYVRLTGVAPKSDVPVGAQCAFAGRYAEHDLGFQIVFHNGGICSFALRTATGEYFAVPASSRVKWGAPVDIVGIRHRGAAYISVNGDEPRRMDLPSTLNLRTPRFIEVMPAYHGVRPVCTVGRIEVGRGWPARVQKPCTVQEVLK